MSVPEPIDQGQMRFDRVMVQRSDMNNAGDLVVTSSGTGSGISHSALVGWTFAGRFGVAQLTTGSTSTGRTAIGSQSNDQIVFGTYPIRFSSSLQTSASLSDGTQRYAILSGFSDSVSSVIPTLGAAFRYRDNLNSGKWQIITANTAGSATADTGITVAANTFYKLDILIDQPAAHAYFWINDALVGTVTNNIPSGTGEPAGFLTLLIKSLGTTARTANIDYMETVREVVR